MKVFASNGLNSLYTKYTVKYHVNKHDSQQSSGVENNQNVFQ